MEFRLNQPVFHTQYMPCIRFLNVWFVAQVRSRAPLPRYFVAPYPTIAEKDFLQETKATVAFLFRFSCSSLQIGRTFTYGLHDGRGVFAEVDKRPPYTVRVGSPQ